MGPAVETGPVGPHVNAPCLAALAPCPCAGPRSLCCAPRSSERPRSPKPPVSSLCPPDPALTSTVFLAKAMPKGFCALQASATVNLYCGQERGKENVTISLGTVTSYCCPALPAPGETRWRSWLCRASSRQGCRRWDLPVPSGQGPGHGCPPSPPHAGGGAAACSDRAFPHMTA